MGRQNFSPFGNFDELPAELQQELRLGSDVETKILRIMQEGGGTLNISEILVGYYKLFKEIKKRAFIASVLSRMNKKALVKPTGKKGEYALTSSSGEQK